MSYKTLHRLTLVAFAVAALACSVPSVSAQSGAVDRDLSSVPVVRIPPLDTGALRAEDDLRNQEGLPPRFAVPTPTLLRPATDGIWDQGDAQVQRWRLRITSPGAVSLNLGFTGYYMPPGGELSIYAVNGSYALAPYTSADNGDHGELWTAVVLADDILVEVKIPRTLRNELILELTSINVGYRGFGELMLDRAGACEIDVICPIADPWRNEIPAIGVISTGGSTFCTGFMVNNTAQDQTPYFMTANHCGINSGNAASLVVYWNFFSPVCGEHGGGSLSTYQSGSTFKASYSTSDFTLVRLTQSPNPAWGITFAGWDHSGNNATSAVGIHHPNTDEKSISFSTTATRITSYGGSSTPGDGSHVRVEWIPVPNNLGVTEPGSSGSPIFSQDHHVLGQLHGGPSACGVPSSDMHDYYGNFAMSWTGGGSASNRLRDWLDPVGTGQSTLDTLNPWAGLQVAPSGGLSAVGDVGGPFAPDSLDYTLHNASNSPITYQVSNSQSWITITNASGALAAGDTATVTVSINASADSLAVGDYDDTIDFTNTTTNQGNTTRSVALHVGIPHLTHSWNLDTDPGWTTEGQWGFGAPLGGGSHNHDPLTAHSGQNVYGYNLSGDYANDMPTALYLTTTAIDCSPVVQTQLKFWRWLGVEDGQFDHATIQVSNNGSTWSTIWSNPVGTNNGVADSGWTQVSYDISAIADGQAAVFIRWSMGPTDSTITYPGWNIDDVEIWGVSTCAGPSISGQPQGEARYVGQSATFSVTATGTSPLSYQWKKGDQLLSDGGRVSGATTSTLTISSLSTADAGNYLCAVTNACNTAASNPASLSVAWLTGDMNCDGVISFADINPFVLALTGQAAYQAAFPNCNWLNADCNHDGVVDFADINPFVALLGS